MSFCYFSKTGAVIDFLLPWNLIPGEREIIGLILINNSFDFPSGGEDEDGKNGTECTCLV